MLITSTINEATSTTQTFHSNSNKLHSIQIQRKQQGNFEFLNANSEKHILGTLFDKIKTQKQMLKDTQLNNQTNYT